MVSTLLGWVEVLKVNTFVKQSYVVSQTLRVWILFGPRDTSSKQHIYSIHYVLDTVLSKENKIINMKDIVPVLLSLQSGRDMKIKYHNAV